MLWQYPEWLAKNKATCPADEYEKYEKQYEGFKRLVVLFEQPGDDMTAISAMMQEVLFSI